MVQRRGDRGHGGRAVHSRRDAIGGLEEVHVRGHVRSPQRVAHRERCEILSISQHDCAGFGLSDGDADHDHSRDGTRPHNTRILQDVTCGMLLILFIGKPECEIVMFTCSWALNSVGMAKDSAARPSDPVMAGLKLLGCRACHTI